MSACAVRLLMCSCCAGSWPGWWCGCHDKLGHQRHRFANVPDTDGDAGGLWHILAVRRYAVVHNSALKTATRASQPSAPPHMFLPSACSF